MSPFIPPVYISGPMTGKPDLNRVAFCRAYDLLLCVYELEEEDILVPDFDDNKPPHVYWRHDLESIMKSRTVLFLEGWKDSAGCIDEWRLAHKLGLLRLVLGDSDAVERMDDNGSGRDLEVLTLIPVAERALLAAMTGGDALSKHDPWSWRMDHICDHALRGARHSTSGFLDFQNYLLQKGDWNAARDSTLSHFTAAVCRAVMALDWAKLEIEQIDKENDNG